MSKDLGKAFEQKLKEDWLKIEGVTIDRLYDSVNGYKSISNISDFIAYRKPNIFYLECKTHKGASIPFDNITQYDKLVDKVGIPGVRAGVVLWLYEQEDFIYYIPISTIKYMKENGEKSFGVRHIKENKYNVIKIPSIKKRTFYDSDYSVLFNLKDGE